MDESPYEDEEIVEDEPRSRKWHWSFLLMRTLAYVANLFGTTASFVAGVATDVTEHANYQIDRDQFEVDAGRELETILSEPEGSEED